MNTFLSYLKERKADGPKGCALFFVNGYRCVTLCEIVPQSCQKTSSCTLQKHRENWAGDEEEKCDGQFVPRYLFSLEII